MLIYHPAFDAFHCIYRAVLITQIHTDIEVGKLRLLDFYLLFPAEVRNIKLPKDLNEEKKLAKQHVNRYRGPVSAPQVFRELEHIQNAALGALAAAGVIDKVALGTGVVRRTALPVPPPLQEMAEKFLAEVPVIIEFVLNRLASFPLNGVDGLKHRSGLMEYRYDNA